LAAFEEMLSTLIPTFGRDDPVYSQANFLHPSFKGYHLKSDAGAYERMLEEIKKLFDEEKHEEPIEDEELEELEVDDDGGRSLCHVAKNFFMQFQTKLQFTCNLLNLPLEVTSTLSVFGRVKKNSFLNWQVWQGPFSPFLQVLIQRTDVSLWPKIAESSKIVNGHRRQFSAIEISIP
jgi:hypothetical protein